MKKFAKYLIIMAVALWVNNGGISAQNMPEITLEGNDLKPIRLSELRIEVVVVGALARTTWDMKFMNENDRQLEGQLNFPLADGQTISRFAMDVAGKLREGVVVERDKGRVAFESIIRQNIDPGLLEKTKGNNFKARIFPIPAKGTKHVVIAYEEALVPDRGAMEYALALDYKYRLDDFVLTAKVYNATGVPKPVKSATPLEFEPEGRGYVTTFAYRNYLASGDFGFRVPAPLNSHNIYIEESDGKNYFYVNFKSEANTHQRPAPQTLTILYDISNSMAKRNREAEFAFLVNYFKKYSNMEITVIPFAEKNYDSRKFVVQGGDWVDLKNYLSGLRCDGSTEFVRLESLYIRTDAALMFSDGIATISKTSTELNIQNLSVINSCASADHDYLRYLANRSGGRYIDLMRITPDRAVGLLSEESDTYISSEGGGSREVLPSTTCRKDADFSIAGIMDGDYAELRVRFLENGSERTEAIILDKSKYEVVGGLVPRLWAQKKIAKLEIFSENNRDEILRIGREFSIVTKNTSLIVLDRIEDYVRHRIVPPPELQAEYFVNVKEIDENQRNTHLRHMDLVAKMYDDYRLWWEKDFSDAAKKHAERDDRKRRARSYSGNGMADPLVPAQRSGSSDEEENLQSEVTVHAVSASSGEGQDLGTMSANIDFVVAATPEPEPAKTIKIAEYDSDKPYADELEDADPGELEKIYFEQKREYGANPGFYIDCADIFMEMGRRDLAYRAMSNIAELEIENHELMRLLGRKLMQYGFSEEAVLVFEEVTRLRPEEPQSWRDLGLACAETGEYQRATDYLYKVITNEWDGRFREIELIALTEMNYLIDKYKDKIDITEYDKRLIAHYPVDLRIVIDWDQDNCDLDLWVTDPFDEKCFYGNREVLSGGLMSRDFTGGYGPEVYVIKKAYPGEYEIQANYYGSRRRVVSGGVFLQTRLYTNWGKDGEQVREVTRMLDEVKDVIDLGEIDIGD